MLYEKWLRFLESASIKGIKPASTCINFQGQYEPLRLNRDGVPLLQNRKSLNLIADATARCIEFDKSGRAPGSHIKSMREHEEFVQEKFVFLADGAIQNTCLLQLSDNMLFPDAPGNGRGHLGANFMEHPMFVSRFKQVRKRHRIICLFLFAKYRVGDISRSAESLYKKVI